MVLGNESEKPDTFFDKWVGYWFGDRSNPASSDVP